MRANTEVEGARAAGRGQGAGCPEPRAGGRAGLAGLRAHLAHASSRREADEAAVRLPACQGPCRARILRSAWRGAGCLPLPRGSLGRGREMPGSMRGHRGPPGPRYGHRWAGHRTQGAPCPDRKPRGGPPGLNAAQLPESVSSPGTLQGGFETAPYCSE